MSSHREDVWAVESFQKLRMLALVIAFALLAITLVVEAEWLHWPRALAWALAGAASIYEGRARKRLGQDPDVHYLRGVACVIVGVVCVL
jgi:hypothetical protein